MSKVNFRTVEILSEIKKTILMRGYNNVDWDVFESWVNDLIVEEKQEGNEQTASNLQLIKDWCRTAKRKNCSDENRYAATNDFLFIHRAIQTAYNSWVDGECEWEDDGTKPKAPSDPKMKEWMESLGCKFEDDETNNTEVA